MHPRIHKTLHKVRCYLLGSLEVLWPTCLNSYWRSKQEKHWASLSPDKQQQLLTRVDYLNKLSQPFTVDEGIRLGDFIRDGSVNYSIDLLKAKRGWPKNYVFRYSFGDIRAIPEQPRLIKSRELGDHNANSVILKLESLRHYYIYPDTTSWDSKKDALVWRGAGHKENRRQFVVDNADNPNFDIGFSHSPEGYQQYNKPFMTIKEQLGFKFILSIEGHDVATNLKWIMASNSLCLMPKPTCETWFMEGRLQAGVHYVEVADDFSDIAEKVAYYLASPAEAKRIVANANAYFAQFLDKKQEQLVTYLVMKKYFQLSGQLEA